MSDCGVYKITNVVTGDFYIGSSAYLRKRYGWHKRELNINCHSNKNLQNDWTKYGGDSFEFSVVEYCEKERLIEREQAHIDIERPVYNICPTAGNRLGAKHSEEARKRMSESKTGELNPMFGKEHSEETKQRMSASKTGERNGFFGRQHSEETKRKIGARFHKEDTNNHLSNQEAIREMAKG